MALKIFSQILSFLTLSVLLSANASEQDASHGRSSGDQKMPSKSHMMDELYGKEVADKVYNRLQELDPELNEVVQKIAYDHFWARPGLNIRDKSLVTVASLIAMGKEEQTKIHMNGFL